MLQVRPLEYSDIFRLKPNDWSKNQVEYMTSIMDEQMIDIAEIDGIVGYWDDEPIVCGGLIEMWEGRATAWAIMGASAKGTQIMKAITRTARMYADIALKNRYHRIEMTSRADFPQGCHWAKMLGFRWEGLMKKYGPFGEDHILYARTR